MELYPLRSGEDDGILKASSVCGINTLQIPPDRKQLCVPFLIRSGHRLTISLFPEFRGNFDDQLPMSCIRVHSTHCCGVRTGEIVEVPPTQTHKKTFTLNDHIGTIQFLYYTQPWSNVGQQSKCNKINKNTLSYLIKKKQK